MIEFVKLSVDPIWDFIDDRYSDMHMYAIDSFKNISEEEYNDGNDNGDNVFKIDSTKYYKKNIGTCLNNIIPKYCNDGKKLCELLENPKFVETIYRQSNNIDIMNIIETKITNVIFVRVVYDDNIRRYFEIHDDDIAALFYLYIERNLRI